MKRPVDHGAMAVSGYTVPWHTATGTPVALHVSSSLPVRDVRIVRLDTPSAEVMDWHVEPTGNAASHRAFDHGSFLKIAATELAKAIDISGVAFEMYLTRNDGARVLFDCGNFRLGLQDGRLTSGHDGKPREIGETLPANTWLTVEISSDGSGTILKIASDDLLSPFRLQRQFDRPWSLSGDMVFGASAANDARSLNAKFSAIALQAAAGRIAWTFPTLLPSGPIASTGGDSVFLLDTVNQPAFCMTSRRWDGSSFEPRLVPSHYDAVHCHDDDMGALDWPASYRLQIPAEASSGIYAFEVGHDEGSERIVFFITSTARRAPLLFLVPTATYLAYADEFLPAHLYEWMCEDRGHRFAIDNNLKSLYDYHSDLSGVSISSTRKPKATLRDDYNYPLCGCPHNLPVDLHFLRFCHNNGIAFDLITDRNLHEREGLASLQGYQAVVTGSHPEYMSVEMELALRQFAATGGSIAYLGGNGFAGKVAFQGDLMELRRSPLEAGRTWDGPIAEQSLSITNQPGGHLRASGRGEFSLTGVAISLMGFDSARPFTRTPQSHEASAAWLFDGVANETFGDEGIVLGGAAGYEVDATDPHLGTSPDTIVIARATGFPESFVHDATRWYEGGAEERVSRRCAEMTLRHLPSGGLIFCASSVAWCGALPTGDAMNDVGRITKNLLTHLATAKDRTNPDRQQQSGRQPATGSS
ncbi:hypothetical protein NKH85_28825 [Mesorhizobium sp. M0924]|uniref:N,N-dimethylformamidase beta subunit family domain-containing protein n=1 Tax=unclassified Mesorhizobium TaxID=325217 RepID=UPI00333939AF